MSKSYKDITTRITNNTKSLHEDIPDIMKNFVALSGAAVKNSILDKKTKELIALAIAVAVRCDGCIGFHIKALIELGVNKKEIEETLGMTIYMGGGPSLMYAAEALSAFEEFKNN